MRKMTKPGLGAVGRRRTHTSLVPPPPVTCPSPRSRREWPEETGSGARPRQPLSDEVGAVAVDMASQLATPRPISGDYTGLELTPREAWIFSFVDGVLDVDAIADVTGAPRREIAAAVHKLAALGLVVFGRAR